MLLERCPPEAWRIASELQGGMTRADCLQEAAAAATLLDEEGMRDRPSWHEILEGARPPALEEDEDEPGEWQHGWQ